MSGASPRSRPSLELLGVLEGAEIQSALEDLFEMRVERTLWARGELKTEECRFAIPPEAPAAFYRDGCRGGEKAKRMRQGLVAE